MANLPPRMNPYSAKVDDQFYAWQAELERRQ